MKTHVFTGSEFGERHTVGSRRANTIDEWYYDIEDARANSQDAKIKINKTLSCMGIGAMA